MQVQSAIRGINLYSRRAVRWHRNSYPYISGDAFADFSDINLSPNFLRNVMPSKRDIGSATIAFISSHELEEKLDTFSGLLRPKILILGNSDRDFPVFDIPLPSSVRKVYVQNLLHGDGFAECLPIGIENLKWATNGLPKLFRGEFGPEVRKSSEVLVGPFGPTHPDRLPLAALKSREKLTRVLEGRYSPVEYARIAASHEFVAAPRGNGLDTHRFWESMYRGSFPVVIETTWSNHWKSMGFPVVEIPDWGYETLQDARQRLILEKQSSIHYDPAEKKELWMPYWLEKFRSDLD